MAASTLAGDVPVIDVPAAPAARPRVVLIGAALAVAGIVVAFGALIGMYVSARAHAKGDWFPAGSIPLTPANMALFTLLLSVPLVHWAGQAVRANDRVNTWVSIGVTCLLGVAFINASTYIWSNSHLGVDKTPGLMLYTVTGAHVALIGLGILFLLIIGLRTLGDANVRNDGELMSAMILYWDVLVAIFAVLWYSIYVTK
ncbi:MAG TPA: cytochrome c oxidase subunit 3 [Acidimicrobiales bacterium]|jgi:heme/copper-type cytochrome/quinol oxidase subunit 3|nr:cytochrome c oxidase subunit 3 [Acidimicrobiales bacterium]